MRLLQCDAKDTGRIFKYKIKLSLKIEENHIWYIDLTLKLVIRWTLDETHSYYTAPEENIPNCYSVTFMPAPSLEFRYLNDVAKVKKGIVFSISHS